MLVPKSFEKIFKFLTSGKIKGTIKKADIRETTAVNTMLIPENKTKDKSCP